MLLTPGPHGHNCICHWDSPWGGVIHLISCPNIPLTFHDRLGEMKTLLESRPSEILRRRAQTKYDTRSAGGKDRDIPPSQLHFWMGATHFNEQHKQEA